MQMQISERKTLKESCALNKKSFFHRNMRNIGIKLTKIIKIYFHVTFSTSTKLKRKVTKQIVVKVIITQNKKSQ